MTDKELYKETFSKIHASELDIQEVIKMAKSSKVSKRIIGRKMFGIAACVGCLLSACLVANAAIGDSMATNETEQENYYYTISLDNDSEDIKEAYACFENQNGEMVYEKLSDISKDYTVYLQVADKNGEISFNQIDDE